MASTLPRDETAFFGRTGEIAEIEGRFNAGARLVTIVGLGGVGKTRLALAAANAIAAKASAASKQPRSTVVTYAVLGETRSLEAAVREVAIAAGVNLKAESQARAALDALGMAFTKRGEPTLLVLDNTEQLGAAARELAAGLLDKTSAKELTILATSREPIGARGEEKLVLSPLEEEEAVTLLRDRARAAAGTAVELTDDDARAIVRRVDRLPLAIELAASRLEVLSAAELLKRLASSVSNEAGGVGSGGEKSGKKQPVPVVDVLTDASGAASPAHRTMRATLDWSWDLLSPVERSALAQASVFAAPFGIDAAEEIISLEATPPSQDANAAPRGVEVLDTLESLVKRSLLLRLTGADGRARLGIFETVRSWAREKLATAVAVTTGTPDEAERAGNPPAPKSESGVYLRHAHHHLAEAERAASRAYGDAAVAALDRLQELLPELLTAFERTKKDHPDIAARIILALSDLLLFRGLFELRSELFDAGAEAAERAKDDRLLARALVAKARVTLELGRMQDAEKELRRALELASKESSSSGGSGGGAGADDVTRAEATRSLGWALTALGRTDEAEAALTSAQKMHREQGSARGYADAHVAMGIMRALQGRPAEGLAHLREALAIHVEHGDVIRQEKVLGFGGLVGHDAREVARGLPREVLARAPKSSMDVLPAHVAELVRGESEANQRWQQAIDLYRQGTLAHDRGDGDAAISKFDKALVALERAGVKRGVAAIHAHAAAVFAAMGDDKEAAARLERARKAVIEERQSKTSSDDGSATKAEPTTAENLASQDVGSDLVVSVFAAAIDVMGVAQQTREDAPSAQREKIEAARDLFERTTRAEVGTPELTFATRVLDRVLRERAASSNNDKERGSEAAAAADKEAPPLSRAVAGGAALIVGKDARFIILPIASSGTGRGAGERIDLVRYGPVRRLLDRLVVARLETPGVALSAEALIEAGWPGERMRHTAGLLRVYSAVRRLRRLGLEPLLITRDDGYLLDPDAHVRRDDG